MKIKTNNSKSNYKLPNNNTPQNNKNKNNILKYYLILQNNSKQVILKFNNFSTLNSYLNINVTSSINNIFHIFFIFVKKNNLYIKIYSNRFKINLNKMILDIYYFLKKLIAMTNISNNSNHLLIKKIVNLMTSNILYFNLNFDTIFHYICFLINSFS
jgi:hypothetical protein